jgi:hypothetical protein
VIVAVLSAEIVEAETVKLADSVPAPTVTEEGTVSKALFLDRATAMPPTGAGLLRATVQVVLAAEVRVAELQPRPVTKVGATRLSGKLAEVPAEEAVIVAVLSTVIAEAVAEKATEEEPAGTVREAGTDSAVLLLERVTTVPPAGAGWLMVRVQELALLEVRELGLQLSEVAGVISMALRTG